VTLAPGAKLGPYEVIASLGAGGMGEVWRAKDTRLDRDVAIKVLPEEFFEDRDRRDRFEREAKLLAAVNHPNIAAIYSFEEISGRYLLIEELLEGESLREALREGPLPSRKAIDVAAQIADGLAAAHAKGIVHRDLKPENVFVTHEGRVKILDFGLARRSAVLSSVASTSPTEAKATTPGELLGTVGYFSPEQVRGEPADHRSDIFAFGCVLHEMLSGKAAFKRETAAETMTAALREEAPTLSVSPELSALVNRCLEKRPEMRFQSAQDLAFALRSLPSASGSSRAEVPARKKRSRLPWALAGMAGLVAITAGLVWHRGRTPAPSPSGTLNPKRILVLPFENVTGDPSLDPVGRMAADWLSQGLLLTEQVEVVTLGVGPGVASGKPNTSLKTLAVDNGAGTVVSGAYYANGKDLEFQARLTDALTGKLLFAPEPVRGPRAEPMQALDRVRQRMMGAVLTRFGLPDVAAVIQKPPLYEAYREYMAGFETIGFDNEKARRHLERAVELDPGFMIAQIRLAAVYGFLGDTPRSDALFVKLRGETEKMTPVERLFLDLMQAQEKGKLIEAYQAARNLHALVPRDRVVLFHHARYALLTNRPRECLETMATMGSWEAVFNEEPGRYRQLTWYIQIEAWAYHLLGEHDKELAEARLGLKLFPDMLSMHVVVTRALAGLGLPEELDRALDTSLSVPPRGGLTPGGVMLVAAEELRAHGKPESARKVAERAAAWFAARMTGEPANEHLAAGHLRALSLLGRWDEARSEAVKATAAFPHSIDLEGYRGVIAARSGDRPGATAASVSLTKTSATGDARSRIWWQACIAAQLGDKERAVALLRAAFGLGEPLIVSCHADWMLEPLRGDPPFEELLKPKG
jgi:serine/threonine protein kinase/tetratricopeptide (TPR) repeat protein